MIGALLAAAPLIGRVLGGAGKGSADQRLSENQQGLQRSQLLAQLYGLQQNAQQRALESGSDERLRQAQTDLAQRGFQQNQREFALQAPSVRARQSVRGSIMANAQPASFSGLPDRVASHVPTLSGGLTPASFSPETRELGRILQRDATLNQLKGDPIDTFAPMQQTDFQSGVMTPPTVPELEKSGLLEKILGGGGLIGSLIGAATNTTAQRPTTPPYNPSDD